MQHTFEIANVKCGGCANTLKSKLLEEFGEIEVNLEVLPRTITLEIEDTKVEALSKALKDLGYPFVSEEMGFLDTQSLKAKSFVSCAIGKFTL